MNMIWYNPVSDVLQVLLKTFWRARQLIDAAQVSICTAGPRIRSLMWIVLPHMGVIERMSVVHGHSLFSVY